MNKKELRKLIKSWRDYANGHYCQTYNKGMADGLFCAANELESLLVLEAHLTKRAVDPPLADDTRTDSKNMFVSPESRTDGTAGN